MVEAISAWARVESPTDCPDGVNRMMDLVATEVADAPIAVERVPGREGLGDTLILRAGPRSDAPCGLVLAHLDTVHPIGTLARDLPVRLAGDRLYGPGVYDMKGGAYLALQAFKARRAARFGPAPARVPGHAGRGDRQPDDAPADRGFCPPRSLCARPRAGARRRQGRDRAQRRRPLRRARGGPPRSRGLAPPGWPQRDPRGGAPDPLPSRP